MLRRGGKVCLGRSGPGQCQNTDRDLTATRSQASQCRLNPFSHTLLKAKTPLYAPCPLRGLFFASSPFVWLPFKKELHMQNQIEELKALLETAADLVALIKRKLDGLPVPIDADGGRS